MAENSILIFLLIALIACLYSCVGHGGASGYLALMAFSTIPLSSIKPVALVLNIVVSLIAFFQFHKRNYFDKTLFVSLIITSIPAAFIGGMIPIDPTLYKHLLGFLLLFSALRLALPSKPKEDYTVKNNMLILLFMGAAIGLISGMIGIGGGIILSPLLILLGYSDAKTTAGISALFIFMNSIAGLLGQMQQGISFTPSMYWMIVVAVAGAIFGSYIGAQQLKVTVLKKVLAVVLIVASIKLIFV